MHIEYFILFRSFEFEKIFQRVTRCERKRRRLRHPDSAMTQRTKPQLPIARQLRRVNNRLVQRLRLAGRVQLDVLFAWSMTPLARDPERVSGSSIAIHRVNRFERRRVTLETARHDRPAEVERSIAITGTVDPTTDFGPVRHRQLKKLIVFPVEISLTFPSGSDDEIKAFRN